MEAKNRYLKKLEDELLLLDAEIEKLRIKTAKARSEAKFQYEGTAAELRRRRIELEKRLEVVRREGREALVDLKSGVEDAWEDLRGAVGSAVSRFK